MNNLRDQRVAFHEFYYSHGKIADYQMCVLVLGQVVDCLKELLTQGQPVKLDGFGTFSPSVDGQGNGKASVEAAVGSVTPRNPRLYLLLNTSLA